MTFEDATQIHSMQRNLPNKRHIGKQDPYCVVEFNGRKVSTKVIKRGGQHPEWDEEIRFTLYEADDDAANASSNGSIPPPPPKKPSRDPLNVQGGKHLKLACYAQDVKEPDLIGETRVDLTEVLTKGETDGALALCFDTQLLRSVLQNGLLSRTRIDTAARCTLNLPSGRMYVIHSPSTIPILTSNGNRNLRQ
jgi:hypothetical protein